MKQQGFGLIFIIVLVLLGFITVGAGFTAYKMKASNSDLGFAAWIEQILSGEKTDLRTIRQNAKDSSPSSSATGLIKKYKTLQFSLSKWDTSQKQFDIDSSSSSIKNHLTLHIQNYDIPMTFNGTIDSSGKVNISGSGDITVTINQLRLSGTATTHYRSSMNGQVDQSGNAIGTFTLISSITKVTGNIPNNPKNDSDSFSWSGKAQ